MRRIFILTAFFVACIISGAYAQDKFVTIGSGGGFTGAVTVYKIMEKGEVFKGTSHTTFTECAPLRKAKAKKIMKDIAETVQATGEFNHPGNLYYFLSVSEGGQEKKITWGSNSDTVPEATVNVYREVQKQIAALKFKPIRKK